MKNTSLPLKDRVGRDVNIGDFIVYAAQQGHSAILNFGKVVDIPAKTEKIVLERAHSDSQGDWIPTQYAQVPSYTLKVQPWDVTKNEPGTDYAKRPARVVTLSFPQRVAVIENF
jgi:hypothetical protein